MTAKSIQNKIRVAYANCAVTPYRVRHIEELHQDTYLYVEDLPEDLTASEWLPILRNSVGDDALCNKYLFLGACTIVSVALATLWNCEVMKVRMPSHRRIIRVTADPSVKVSELLPTDMEVIYHTDHLLLTKWCLQTGKRLVMDCTGVQFDWDPFILNQWVPLETYVRTTGVTSSSIMHPDAYLTCSPRTAQEKQHQAAMRAMIRVLRG